MEWLADTHVHVYPVHDPAILFHQALAQLRQRAQTTSPCCALFLTEGAGHDYFGQLLSGDHRLTADWQVSPGPEPHVVVVRTAGGDARGDNFSAHSQGNTEVAPPVHDKQNQLPYKHSGGTCSVTSSENRRESAGNGSDPLWVFQGRQFVARERVEILALAGNPDIADGQPAAEIIEQVHAADAIPVLAWSPGKWLFQRAKVVAQLLAQFGPDDLWLGDSALRPIGWPTPGPMRSSQRRILAGTDPLPFVGDEQQAGGYGIRVEANFDPQQPLTSARSMLRSPAKELASFGNRNTPVTMLQRMQRHRAQKKAGAS